MILPSADASRWELYRRANAFLDEGLIRLSTPATNPRTRRQWMEWLLPDLGHPEESFAAIHVAGTSGKGSVAFFIAEILRAANLSVGLHISPYLQVSTEKLWVNGHYASAEEFAGLVEWIRPIAEARRDPRVPLHGMASVGLALEHFRRSGVEWGVVEVGVGGRDDLTNVLRTAVAVITSVGLDHLKTLGPTLEDIAWHKAGIIKTGCRAVVLDGTARAAAQKQAALVGAPLSTITQDRYGARPDAEGRIQFHYRGPRLRLEEIPLGMLGPFQAQNAALAVAAIEELAALGVVISEEHVALGLQRARLPARLERLAPSEKNPCPVLLDGAHNPDKLAALLASLPSLAFRRLHVVYGALASREVSHPLRRLLERAHTLVLTEPRVYAKPSLTTEELQAGLPAATDGLVLQETDPEVALDLALARAAPGDLVLVTGSLYLCGQLRDRWYPAEKVLTHQRSWF